MPTMALTCRKNVPIEQMKVGDYVWCKYTATTSGAVGYFSDFGTKNDAEATAAGVISTSAPGATPNGYFKLICVGVNAQGKVKFLADRAIQSTISWDALNTAGFGSLGGVKNTGVNPDINSYTAYVRMITGGVSATDFANEWDKYIVYSTLNGNITAGDNTTWNWSGIYNWTPNCYTTTPANRNVRGSGSVSTSTNIVSTTVNASYAFRPTIMYEIPTFTKYLVQSGTSIKRHNGTDWETIGTSPVTAVMFETYGMDTKPTDAQINTVGVCKLLTYTNDVPSTTPTISGKSYAVSGKTSKTISLTDKKYYEKTDLTAETIGVSDTLKVVTTDADYSTTTPITFPAPVAPTNLEFTTNGYNVSYTWTGTSTGRYRLYSGTTLITETTNTNYTETRTTEVSKDVFVVSIAPLAGESDLSNTVTVSTIPNAPTGLSISQIPTGFVLTWDENSSINTGHKIYKRIDGGSWTLLNAVNDVNTYTDTFSYVGGTLYEYQICSYNAVGESNYITWGIEILDSVVLNAVLDDANNVIHYSWNASPGADTYELHLNTNSVGSTITQAEMTYDYTITGETVQSAYVIAKDSTAYGNVQSSNSNTTNITSSPRTNVSGIVAVSTIVDNNYSIALSWTDNSKVEDLFRVAYQIDAQSWETVDVATGSKSFVGSTINHTLTIPYGTVNTSVQVKIATVNAFGVTPYTDPIQLIRPSYITQGFYDETNSLAKIAWKDDSLLESKYRLTYSIDGGGEYEVDVDTTLGVSGNVYIRNVSMNVNSELTASIKPYANGVWGLPTKSFKVAKVYNTTLDVPASFTADWESDGVAKYFWTDNTVGEMGYQVEYTINGGSVTTLDIPSTTVEATGHIYNVTMALQNLDAVNARVRAYDIFGQYGAWSNWIEETYYDFVPTVPANYRREPIANGVRLSWNPVDYINYYEITYTIDGVTSTPRTASTYLDIAIDYSVIKSFSAYLKAYYSGGKQSPVSDTITFTPIWVDNGQQTIVYTHTSTDYANTQVRYNKGLVKNNTLSTATTTYNVSSGLSDIYTKTVTYGTFNTGYLQEKIIYINRNENPLHGFISNPSLQNFALEQKTFSAGMSGSFPTCVASIQKDLVNFNATSNMIVKNQNVLKEGQISSWIKQVGIKTFDTPVVTLSYLKTSNEIEPIYSTIYTKCDLSVSIETEIHKIRVCTMGDSITAGHPGYWAESHTGRVTSQYQYWLQKRLKDEFEVQNNGYGSDTTLRCLNRFDRDIVSQSPQYCIIQAGTNDIHWALAERKDDQAYLDAKMEAAKVNIIAMVEKCVTNNIIPIVGTLIPRTSATGIYRKALLDYNSWIINYCNGRDDCYYADFYNAGKQNIPPTPLEEPAVVGNMNPLYDGDSTFDQYGNLLRRGQGVHPSDVGYKLMAEAIPLSLFKSLASGIALYQDEACTIEESSTVSADTTKSYNISLKNMNRGKTKTTSRYLKNTGTSTVIYSLISTKEIGLDIKFSKDGILYTDRLEGTLSPNSTAQLFMKINVPQFGDIPNLALNIATRSFKTK